MAMKEGRGSATAGDSRHGIKKAAEMGLLCESFLGGAGEVAFVALSATVFCDLHSA